VNMMGESHWGSFEFWGLRFRVLSSLGAGSIIARLQDACEDPLPNYCMNYWGKEGTMLV
jgi:hypothetical protein